MSADRVFVPADALPQEGLRAFDAEGTRLLLCRVDGALYALENRCPHALIPLDTGRLSGCVLECPLHGGKLDVRDGRPVAQPIRRNARTFRVRTVDGGAWIQLTPAAPAAHGGPDA